MPSPILARADALMQRRRSTILDADDDVPVLTDSISEEDDFPVLLDIETLPEVFEVIPETTPAVEIKEEYPSHPLLDAGMRDILAHELARRVEQRLAAELPRIIESTVRDFLAEQEMIAALQPQE
ncbi:MAG: hypothetical protein ABTQ26_19975 [Azonexus sp.]